MIPEDEISEEDDEMLDKLAEETRKKGVLWEQVKSDLDL